MDDYLKRLNSLKDTLSDLNTHDEKRCLIEKTFEFIEQDIEIRIESLKCSLETIGISLTNSIERSSTSTKSAKSLAHLLILTQVSMPVVNLTKEIGCLNFGFNSEKLKSFQINVFQIEKFVKYPMGLCWSGVAMSNSYHYAVVDYSNCDLIMFDKTFGFKQRFKAIFEVMKPVRLETNYKDIFYLLDNSKQTISILKKTRQQNVVAFLVIRENCIDICFFRDHLYALCLEYDSSKEIAKINKYVHTGVLKTSSMLSGVLYKNVNSMKINENFIAILENFKTIKIFDFIGEFKFCFNLDASVSCICFADGRHLLTLNECGYLKCYELEAACLVLRNEISHGLPKNEPYVMNYWGEKIVICYPWKKQICILN